MIIVKGLSLMYKMYMLLILFVSYAMPSFAVVEQQVVHIHGTVTDVTGAYVLSGAELTFTSNIDTEIVSSDEEGNYTVDLWVSPETVGVDDNPTPYPIELSQNYPNPFNPSTTIPFAIAEPGNVRLDIYSISGQKVKTLIDDYYYQGSHAVVWDGRDDKGVFMASGVYLYSVSTGTVRETRKMVLLDSGISRSGSDVSVAVGKTGVSSAMGYKISVSATRTDCFPFSGERFLTNTDQFEIHMDITMSTTEVWEKKLEIRQQEQLLLERYPNTRLLYDGENGGLSTLYSGSSAPIYLPLDRMNEEQISDAAREFLADYDALFRIRGSEMRDYSVSERDTAFEVTFQQYYKVIPVDGARIRFSVLLDGQVTSINNGFEDLSDGLNGSATPTLLSGDALVIAQELYNIPDETTSKYDRLDMSMCVFAENGENHLCWFLSLIFHQLGVFSDLYIDAYSGEILADKLNIRY